MNANNIVIEARQELQKIQIPKLDLSKTNELLTKQIEELKLLPPEVLENSNLQQLLQDVVNLKK